MTWGPKGPFTVTFSCGHVVTLSTFGAVPEIGKPMQCHLCAMKLRTVAALREGATR